MTIENIAPFGRFVPGDLLVIPDGHVFDSAYFRAMHEVTKTFDHEVSEVVTHEVTETVVTEVPETVTQLEPVEGN